MSKAIAIYPDKRVENIDLVGLTDMQAVVKGNIEVIRLTFGDMYVNEEFLLGQFGPDDFNSIASDVAGIGNRPDLMMTGILGPVFLLGPVNMRTGNDTDVTDKGRKAVRRVGREAGMVPANFGLKGAN